MTRARLLLAAFCIAALAGRAVIAAEAPLTIAVPQPASSQKVQLGLGDQVRVEFFGNTDLATTAVVGEDGTIRMPLTGPVKVMGKSPTEAAKSIEDAFREGEFLVDPHVTVTVVSSSSQRVSVVGEVRNPGRYPIESNTTVLDVIALAGGVTEKASDTITIYRPDAAGKVQPVQVNSHAFMAAGGPSGAMEQVRGGDSIVVQKATFMITGEVRQPGEYRVESGMTLLQAISRAGDVTALGSSSRVEIRRRSADGKYVEIKAKKDTRIESGDIIKVKERLF